MTETERENILEANPEYLRVVICYKNLESEHLPCRQPWKNYVISPIEIPYLLSGQMIEFGVFQWDDICETLSRESETKKANNFGLGLWY